MPADKTRISHDPRQRYRDVVWQQGRVLNEADWNEAWSIAGDESREALLDVVGPAGTPDDGYKIGPPPPIVPPMTPVPPPFDFMIGAGSMYVGGFRLTLPEPIRYSDQPEWLDRAGHPLWVDPDTQPAANELIVLAIQEQEVGAVEDEALREVALGGPDTAARTRLVQRMVRVPVDARDCAGAMAELSERLLGQGLAFDETTMRLASSGLLQAAWTQDAPEPDPCEPEAQGGYLGADNQLIRVQIVDFDPAAGTGRLLWGYDNASFLHRVTVVDNQTVTLDTAPVDLEHEPIRPPIRVVELLRAAVALANGGFVAAAVGHLSGVAGYDRDERRLALGAAMPAAFPPTTPTEQLYLRLWNEELGFALNAAVPLGDTGLEVTIAAPPAPGDFWQIAVRPETPTEVYPERFLTPQPPDGPGRWLCPLAVLGWPGGQFHVLEDCREHFADLVELTRRRGGGCCTVTLRPGDLRGGRTLQSIADALAHPVPVGKEREGHAHPVTERPTICLLPGEYALEAPLRLGPRHSNLTIEACHDGVILRAADGRDEVFGSGLIEIVGAEGITLKGLRVVLPMPPLRDLNQESHPLAPELRPMRYAIGIRALACARLTIAECLFRYRLGPERLLTAVGLYLSGEFWGLTLRDNRFLHDGKHLVMNDFEQDQMLLGVLLTPAVVVGAPNDGDDAGRLACRAARALLHDATIQNNRFSGLTAALLVNANLGRVELIGNTVRNCYAGVGLFDLRSRRVAGGAIMVLAFASHLFQLGFRIPELWRRLLVLLMGGFPLPQDLPPWLLHETPCETRLESLPEFMGGPLSQPVTANREIDAPDERLLIAEAVLRALRLRDESENVAVIGQNPFVAAWNDLPELFRRHLAAYAWLVARESTWCDVILGLLGGDRRDDDAADVWRRDVQLLHGNLVLDRNDVDVRIATGPSTVALALVLDECDPHSQVIATANALRNGPTPEQRYIEQSGGAD